MVFSPFYAKTSGNAGNLLCCYLVALDGNCYSSACTAGGFDQYFYSYCLFACASLSCQPDITVFEFYSF